MRPHSLTLCTLLALGLLTAACGDDSDGGEAAAGASTTAAVSETTLSPGSDAPETTAAAPSTTAATTSSVAAPGAGSDPDSAFCRQARVLSESDSFDALAGGGTPDEVRDGIAEARAEYEELIDVAPAEVAPDLDTIARLLADFDAFYEPYDYDIAQLTAAAAADPSIMETNPLLSGGEELAAASERIGVYGRDVCGIAIDS
jgi:hypothetical protein